MCTERVHVRVWSWHWVSSLVILDFIQWVSLTESTALPLWLASLPRKSHCLLSASLRVCYICPAVCKCSHLQSKHFIQGAISPASFSFFVLRCWAGGVLTLQPGWPQTVIFLHQLPKGCNYTDVCPYNCQGPIFMSEKDVLIKTVLFLFFLILWHPFSQKGLMISASGHSISLWGGSELWPPPPYQGVTCHPSCNNSQGLTRQVRPQAKKAFVCLSPSGTMGLLWCPVSPLPMGLEALFCADTAAGKKWGRIRHCVGLLLPINSLGDSLKNPTFKVLRWLPFEATVRVRRTTASCWFLWMTLWEIFNEWSLIPLLTLRTLHAVYGLGMV